MGGSFFSFSFSLIFLLSILTWRGGSVSSGGGFMVGGLRKLVGAHKGDNIKGISQLKQYMRRFGYLDQANVTTACPECFDGSLESALKLYQQSFELPVTGYLDEGTIAQMMIPRCGVPDVINGTSTMLIGKGNQSHTHTVRHYTYFDGKPKWSKPVLTYAFPPRGRDPQMDQGRVKTEFSKAFAHWSAVVPALTFQLTQDYATADIQIGFFTLYHGDGVPFDGPAPYGPILAHSFPPQDGRLHMDDSESWSFDLEENPLADYAIDMESVATHEIGHILGLGHSRVREAIMYPSISPKTKKVNLASDDIEGIQGLYGSQANTRNVTSLLSPYTAEKYVENSGLLRLDIYSVCVASLFSCLFSWGVILLV